MIFGQGVMRAHPYAYKEISSAEKGDLKAFDVVFWKHVGHIVRNKIRSVFLSVTRGYIASRGMGGPAGRYYQKLAWASASFAILTDVAMGTLGGQLKTKEKITGRYADVLSWMYIGTAVLSRFESEGRKKEDLALVHYNMQVVFAEIQKGFDGILQNIQIPGLSWFFRGVLLPWSRLNTIGSYPSDDLGQKVAASFLKPSAFRDRHTKGSYIPTDAKNEQVARLDYAMLKVVEAAGIEKKVKKAIKAKALPKRNVKSLLDEAVTKNIITAAEKSVLAEAEALTWDAIQVDDFTQEQYVTRSTKSELSGLSKNLS
jgi:acyl-CoA dehydrogenase